MYKWPLDRIHVTQKFAERPEVYKKFGLKAHNGCDLRTRFLNSPLGHRYVTAIADGVIEEIRYDISGYGCHIRHRLDDGTLVIYGHLSKPYVAIKSRVKAGDRIGLSGNTGFSSAPHLHLEIRPAPLKSNNGYAGAVDPLPYFPKL